MVLHTFCVNHLGIRDATVTRRRELRLVSLDTVNEGFRRLLVCTIVRNSFLNEPIIHFVLPRPRLRWFLCGSGLGFRFLERRYPDMLRQSTRLILSRCWRHGAPCSCSVPE